MAPDTTLLQAWLRTRDAPWLDLRSTAAFCAGHLRDSSHLPFPDLVLRRHELPLPGTRLHLLHDEPAALAAAADLLRQWGYPIGEQYCLNAVQRTELSGSPAWCVDKQSRPLWQANASLRLAVEQHRVALASLPQLPALDLACGSGRDALFLAQLGFPVIAIDHKPDALLRLQTSAAALDLRIDSRCQDLEAADFQLPAQAFVLISVARYLHRPLLPVLADALVPGGWLVYETFAQGAERLGGPRRPAFLLAPGELAAAFAGWQVAHDAIVSLPDGRPVQQFIARKPG